MKTTSTQLRWVFIILSNDALRDTCYVQCYLWLWLFCLYFFPWRRWYCYFDKILKYSLLVFFHFSFFIINQLTMTQLNWHHSRVYAQLGGANACWRQTSYNQTWPTPNHLKTCDLDLPTCQLLLINNFYSYLYRLTVHKNLHDFLDSPSKFNAPLCCALLTQKPKKKSSPILNSNWLIIAKSTGTNQHNQSLRYPTNK